MLLDGLHANDPDYLIYKKNAVSDASLLTLISSEPPPIFVELDDTAY